MTVRKRPKTLAHGRPPISKPKERMTSERSRTIIRTHHRLQKEHAAALKRGDAKAVENLSEAIEKNGGIKTYQAASKQGQSKDRGGDSSKQLVDWLRAANVLSPQTNDSKRASEPVLRCLEVGALSTQNEISNFAGTIDMTRIDLNSQGPGIEQQDFMQRPIPTSDEHRFDLISLSLVLNYVPDAPGRGEMLRRLTKFLRRPESPDIDGATSLPALFLVLPLPCVDNSRYLDEKLLVQIMGNLGFTKRFSKNTSKLCYYLFVWTHPPTSKITPKRRIRSGPTMNNFCIIVE